MAAVEVAERRIRLHLLQLAAQSSRLRDAPQVVEHRDQVGHDLRVRGFAFESIAPAPAPPRPDCRGVGRRRPACCRSSRIAGPVRWPRAPTSRRRPVAPRRATRRRGCSCTSRRWSPRRSTRVRTPRIPAAAENRSSGRPRSRRNPPSVGRLPRVRLTCPIEEMDVAAAAPGVVDVDLLVVGPAGPSPWRRPRS